MKPETKLFHNKTHWQTNDFKPLPTFVYFDTIISKDFLRTFGLKLKNCIGQLCILRYDFPMEIFLGNFVYPLEKSLPDSFGSFVIHEMLLNLPLPCTSSARMRTTLPSAQLLFMSSCLLVCVCNEKCWPFKTWVVLYRFLSSYPFYGFS